MTAALKRSSDRKTTFSVNKKGTQANVNNAFGLPSGKAFSCPGATSICESVCYAGKLEKIYPGVRNAMLHNWNALQGQTLAGMAVLLIDMLSEFRADCEKRGAEKAFRIHHDGDFFSWDYARAWETACATFPDIQFWVYTRSFTPTLDVVPILRDIPNLTLFLSVDADNVEHAAKYPDIRHAYLGKTWEDAKALSVSERSVAKCPELTKALPLISTKGGACSVCKLCVKGDASTKADVAFSSSKK